MHAVEIFLFQTSDVVLTNSFFTNWICKFLLIPVLQMNLLQQMI